ncbi:LysE family translocator [Mariprofundus sp. NF]|uniref:LysE family translocator n=1 Tax=Mariprofundus sp. NF TaxID=2608716 RepID=UPI0015A365AA|nr:LysE family transporter [Mariprofundus sp. NF]NWF38052.1 LysE family translocator [Mariprofundus sp. NF]
MIHYLSLGVVLGLYAGLTPGPLLTLVISETLQHDFKAGFKVAIAPIISDAPIILLSLFVMQQLANLEQVLALISLTGGVFISWLAYQSVRFQGVKLHLQPVKSDALRRGVLVNLLSPYPYLFWLSVGAPLINKAQSEHTMAPALFILGFYSLLVGLKILLAYWVGQSRSFLQGSSYIYTVRFLGLILFALAFSLFSDAYAFWGQHAATLAS